MIAVQNVSKTMSGRPIVQDVSFTVPDGSITGFVGPNGAGKSTTMRIMLGLTRADTGSARFDGIDYRRAKKPLRLVGSLLDARGLIPNLKTHQVLDYCALTQGVASDTQAMLELVGLGDAGGQRVAHLSLGMRQRLGFAVALIASPKNLVLDEPLNGLDPTGIVWLRDLLSKLRNQGCSILLSSHIISELALIADDIVIIAEGRIVLTGSLAELAARGRPRVIARTDRADVLAAAVETADGQARVARTGELHVSGLTAREVFATAVSSGIALDELTTSGRTLDDTYRDAINVATTSESS